MAEAEDGSLRRLTELINPGKADQETREKTPISNVRNERDIIEDILDTKNILRILCTALCQWIRKLR